MCYRDIDFFIVLDSSISITTEKYEIAKEFVVDLVSSLTIGKNNVRGGLVIYGHYGSTICLQCDLDNTRPKLMFTGICLKHCISFLWLSPFLLQDSWANFLLQYTYRAKFPIEFTLAVGYHVDHETLTFPVLLTCHLAGRLSGAWHMWPSLRKPAMFAPGSN